MRVGSYCYISSWLVLKADATRDLKWVILICNEESPGTWRPESPYLGHWVRRIGGEISSFRADYRVEE
jgi:hypothetical protein